LCVGPGASTLGCLARFARACRHDRVEDATDAIRSLSLASLARHAELASLGTGFERRGILSVYEDDERFADDRRDAVRSGLPSRVLTPVEARELQPALPGQAVGAIYFPDEGHVDPMRYVGALAHAAASAGAEINTGVEVRSVAGSTVATDMGSLRPQSVVLAAGAWTGGFARIPITGGKG